MGEDFGMLPPISVNAGSKSFTRKRLRIFERFKSNRTVVFTVEHHEAARPRRDKFVGETVGAFV